MIVPFLDLKAQYATLKNEMLASIEKVLVSQIFIGGPVVTELETAIAKASDCKYAVGISSGTDAILNVLMSLDIGPNDEAIKPPSLFLQQ